MNQINIIHFHPPPILTCGYKTALVSCKTTNTR